jgi:hypothetical protein
LTGECLIHLYAKGQSRRGPSYRIPSQSIKAEYWETLYSNFGSRRYFVDRNSTTNFSLNLYIPAPRNTNRGDSFDWHIATRNFFAFCCGKPLVGSGIGQAIISLTKRLQLWNAKGRNAIDDVTTYLGQMGYLDFTHCPDYALGALQFAETFQLEDLWLDAFAHCVGMNQILYMSNEFQKISYSTKANIDDSSDQLDTHLGSVTESLSNFLEHDLSPSHLGLAPGARIHLDRFRAFLHSFYVRKFGYWPPPTQATFAKPLFQSIYFDFQSLYNYLVDLDCTNSLQHQRPATGGICVLQNLQAFDERHNYEPLPHPNPRLPEKLSIRRQSQSQRALQTLRIGNRAESITESSRVGNALAAAANATNMKVVNAPLVKAYRDFERDPTNRKDEKISIADGRKVRWIVIYCTLQLVISVLRAPSQVKDVYGPTYPLCCDVSHLPPWKSQDLNPEETAAISLPPKSSHGSPTNLEPDNKDNSEVQLSTPVEEDMDISITPDCQMDNYNDHIEVTKISSWRHTLNIREPSTTAVRELHTELQRGGSQHQRARSKSHSDDSSSLRRLSSLLRRRSTYGSRPTTMHSSSSFGPVSPSPTIDSLKTSDGQRTRDSATLEKLDPAAIWEESLIQAPHPTPSRDGTTAESAFDFGSQTVTESPVDMNQPQNNENENNESNVTTPKKPIHPPESSKRSPLLDSIDVERLVPKEPQRGRLRTPTSRASHTLSSPLKTPIPHVEAPSDKRGRAKSANRWTRFDFDGALRPSMKNRRLTLGTWSSTDKHGASGGNDSKRLRYSLLIKAI